jgi:hypothetical protein
MINLELCLSVEPSTVVECITKEEGILVQTAARISGQLLRGYFRTNPREHAELQQNMLQLCCYVYVHYTCKYNSNS